MNSISRNMRRLVLVATLGVAALALAACSDSDASEDGDAEVDAGIEVTGAWGRATAGNPGENTAIYAVITNNSGEEDVLVGVGVSEEIALRAEVHEMIQQGENMVMQQVEGGLTIADSEVATLEPGGYHVMLTSVRSQLTPGQTFPAAFIFESAGELEVQVEVREASSMGSMGN